MKNKINGRLVDALLITFVILSAFHLIKVVFFSENNYRTIKEYRKSIEYLNQLVEKERKKNAALKEKLEKLHQNRTLYLEVFTRDYLFMNRPDEWIILKRETP
jgi:cell division protein FtsB